MLVKLLASCSLVASLENCSKGLSRFTDEVADEIAGFCDLHDLRKLPQIDREHHEVAARAILRHVLQTHSERFRKKIQIEEHLERLMIVTFAPIDPVDACSLIEHYLDGFGAPIRAIMPRCGEVTEAEKQAFDEFATKLSRHKKEYPLPPIHRRACPIKAVSVNTSVYDERVFDAYIAMRDENLKIIEDEGTSDEILCVETLMEELGILVEYPGLAEFHSAADGWRAIEIQQQALKMMEEAASRDFHNFYEFMSLNTVVNIRKRAGRRKFYKNIWNFVGVIGLT